MIECFHLICSIFDFFFFNQSWVYTFGSVVVSAPVDEAAAEEVQVQENLIMLWVWKRYCNDASLYMWYTFDADSQSALWSWYSANDHVDAYFYTYRWPMNHLQRNYVVDLKLFVTEFKMCLSGTFLCVYVCVCVCSKVREKVGEQKCACVFFGGGLFFSSFHHHYFG